MRKALAAACQRLLPLHVRTRTALAPPWAPIAAAGGGAHR